MPSLYATSGPEEGTRYRIDKPVMILGRSVQSDIHIADPRASRSHARIRANGERHILEDLQGRQDLGGGTFVNGRIATWHLLQDSDEITIAGVTFRFEIDEEIEPTERMRLTNILADLSDDDVESGGSIHEAVEASTSNPRTMLASLGGPVLAEAHERLCTIYEVSNAIGTIFDQAQLIEAILGALLRVYRQASRLVFLTIDKETGELVERAEKIREGLATRKVPISRKVMQEVLEHKRAVIFGGLSAEKNKSFTGMMTHSMLCAPLCVRGEIFGVIHLTSKDLISPFVRADLDLLAGIANQAAIAMQNAEMHHELLAQERLRHDVEIAREIQRRFLPLVPPRLHGWSFATEYQPAFAVGGDFYDFIPLGTERIGVLIGDVSGKGVSAALLMARVTSEFRTLAMIEPAPEAVMARVNASLVAAGYEGVFVTACYMVIDLQRGELSYCNAGHLPPLVRRRNTGEVERLETGDLALGVLDETEFTHVTVPLGFGDVVVLMSDGVVESTNAQSEQLGFARIEEVIGQSRAEADGTLEELMAAVRTFVGTASQYDDLTTVCFSRDPDDTRRTISPESAFAAQATAFGWNKG